MRTIGIWIIFIEEDYHLSMRPQVQTSLLQLRHKSQRHVALGLKKTLRH